MDAGKEGLAIEDLDIERMPEITMKLVLPEDLFVQELVQEFIVSGVRPALAISQTLSQHLEESVKLYVGDRLIKPPTIKMMGLDRYDSVFTLPELISKGFVTWYPEICFSTNISDAFSDISVEPIGFSLGSFGVVRGMHKNCNVKISPLKKQVNHVLKFQNIRINGAVFSKVLENIKGIPLENPYIANASPKFGNETLFHQIVSFDRMIDGRKFFCSCAKSAHEKMLADAIGRSHQYASGSWPHRIVQVLSDVEYIESICHLCIARDFGSEAASERYGDSTRDFIDAYVTQLTIGDGVDSRTAKADVQTRLGLSRWVQEAEMYRLIKRLFPDDMVLREASPTWLGRQRLDVFLPDRHLAVEYQGAQHYNPVELFGGAEALRRTIERDALKKRLCEENQVELVYIKHTDPLTLTSLRHRLRGFIGEKATLRDESFRLEE